MTTVADCDFMRELWHCIEYSVIQFVIQMLILSVRLIQLFAIDDEGQTILPESGCEKNCLLPVNTQRGFSMCIRNKPIGVCVCGLNIYSNTVFSSTLKTNGRALVFLHSRKLCGHVIVRMLPENHTQLNLH